MKNRIILIAIIFVGLFSCSKADQEHLPVLEPEFSSIEQQLLVENPSILNISQVMERNEQAECQAPSCAGYIQEYAALLQAHANEYCITVYDCIECCLNNWIVFATLEVTPNSPKCRLSSMTCKLANE